MRKQPTFEELANEALAKPTLVATPLQTVYPDDNTFAANEFRHMMNELSQTTVAGEAARAAQQRPERRRHSSGTTKIYPFTQRALPFSFENAPDTAGI